MVYDDGPFPCGRIAIFTWKDGTKKTKYYESRFTPTVDYIPKNFIGIESIAMRNGVLHDVREFTDDPKQEKLLFNAAEHTFTDAGFLIAHFPDLVYLFTFDLVGDIATIDWDEVKRDDFNDNKILRVFKESISYSDGDFLCSLECACRHTDYKYWKELQNMQWNEEEYNSF